MTPSTYNEILSLTWLQRCVALTAACCLALAAAPALAQQEDTYDYWQPQREMIRRGQQAVFMCNGLFTSNRSLEQVFAQELAFLPEPIGTPEGGDYQVNQELRAVEVGTPGMAPTMRAVFREKI